MCIVFLKLPLLFTTLLWLPYVSFQMCYNFKRQNVPVSEPTPLCEMFYISCHQLKSLTCIYSSSPSGTAWPKLPTHSVIKDSTFLLSTYCEAVGFCIEALQTFILHFLRSKLCFIFMKHTFAAAQKWHYILNKLHKIKISL